MILLGHCPDSVGLLALVCNFFAERGLNIVNLEEHTENERFFIRLVTDNARPLNEVAAAFAPLGQKMAMEYAFYEDETKSRVALFCSESLHCPLEVLSRQLSRALKVEVIGIVSNARAIEPVAAKAGIPFVYTPTQPQSFAHEAEQLATLKTWQPDLVALGRYMKILSAAFIETADLPIINIHHSFLPSFIGGKPYEMAYARGVKIVGATAHFVTEKLDEGPIIAQGVLPVSHSLSVEEMKQSGAHIEKAVFAEAIEKFSERKILEWQGRTVVFQ